MDKLRVIMVSILVIGLMMIAGTMSIQATGNSLINEKEPVKLTDSQKSELTAIHKEVFEKKKELVNKYIEFGLISKEKGEKIISKMEKHLENLDEKGLPRWHRVRLDDLTKIKVI